MEERGWDPGVKIFFKKIFYSFFFGIAWLISFVFAGIYKQLAYLSRKPLVYTIIFYVIALVTLIILIRYLRRIWRKP
jgi:hypothetical protein